METNNNTSNREKQMLLSESFHFLEASHTDLTEKHSVSFFIIIIPVPHIKVCLSLTRQSVGLGPVQPAAQCSLQQSLGEGPLHLLEHCCAQFSFVTGDRNKTNLVERQVPSGFY